MPPAIDHLVAVSSFDLPDMPSYDYLVPVPVAHGLSSTVNADYMQKFVPPSVPAPDAAQPPVFSSTQGVSGVSVGPVDLSGTDGQKMTDLMLSLDISRLTAKQKESGYLTLPPGFNVGTLRKMGDLKTVAMKDAAGEAMGVMCASTPDPQSPSPFLQALFNKVADTPVNGHKWCVYGPMGVGHGYQGQGVAPKMFANLRDELKSGTDYEYMVGFVALENAASYGVHTKKFGFEDVGHFQCNGKEFAAIVYDLRASPAKA